MTFEELKNIKNIDSSTGRVYDTPDGQFVSVTTMLSKTANKQGLLAWRNKIGDEEADKIVKASAERGTKMHAYLEDYMIKNSTATLDNAREYVRTSGLLQEPYDIQVMAKSIIKFLANNNFTSLAQEIAVWDTELKIAGRCDNIGLLFGKLVLLDYKSSRSEKQRKYVEDYYLQATAYCKAFNQLFSNNKITGFHILVANELGGFQHFSGLPNSKVGELRYRVKQYYNLKEKE